MRLKTPPSASLSVFLGPLLAFACLGAACTGPDPFYRGGDPIGGEGGNIGAGGPTGGAQGSGQGGVVGQGQGGTVGSGSGGATGRGGTTGSGNGGAVGSGGTVGSGAGGRVAPGDLPWTETFEPTPSHSWISPSGDTGTWALGTDGSNHIWRQSTVTSDEAQSISGNIAWTNYVVEARVRATGGSAGSVRVMVYARFTDDENYFFLELSETQIKVRKKIGGSSTDIGRYKFPTGTVLTLNTWYTVKIEIGNGIARGYFNGMPTDPVADNASPLPMGGIGVGVSDGSADFDDVKVTAQ